MLLKATFTLFCVVMLTLGFALSSPTAQAETLNPEGINPHADAPRKRITQEQKLAAAEAMKKKKAEIEARKAAEAAGKPASLPALAPHNGSDTTVK
jgi:hypothetical protein